MYVSSLPVSAAAAAAAAAANGVRAGIMSAAHNKASQLPSRGKHATCYAVRLRHGLCQAWATHKETKPEPEPRGEDTELLIKTITAIAPAIFRSAKSTYDCHQLYFGTVKADQALPIIRAAWHVNKQVPVLYPLRKDDIEFYIITTSGDSLSLHFSRIAGYVPQTIPELDEFEEQRQRLKLPYVEESFPVMFSNQV